MWDGVGSVVGGRVGESERLFACGRWAGSTYGSIGG